MLISESFYGFSLNIFYRFSTLLTLTSQYCCFVSPQDGEGVGGIRCGDPSSWRSMSRWPSGMSTLQKNASLIKYFRSENLENVRRKSRSKISVENLGRAIIAAGKPVNMGEYPMLFTDIHDLSMAHVLRELIRSQKQDIQTIVDCVQELEEDPPNRNFAEECLGAAKGHLEALEGLGVAANVVG